MNFELAAWLGIAVLALVWANLSLWSARRALSRASQDAKVQEARLAPSVLVPNVPPEPVAALLAS